MLYKLYNCADDFKYCTCAKRETFKQLAGEQCKVICGAWASKHTYCGEGGVVQWSLQREKDSGDSGK